MSATVSRPRPRPAHGLGCTRCAYTPNGRQLISVGATNTIRIYRTGSDGEPTNVDDCQEQNVSVVATDEFFVAGSEDGTVSLYSLDTNSFESFLLRTSLPVRDVALSPDGRWCAVASDELTVRLVRVDDNTVVRHLRAHNRPAKHVSFDPKGRTVTVSCTDGIIYVYSLIETEDEDQDDGSGVGNANGDPALIRKIDGIIGSLESEADASAKIAWHPDGRAFAVPTPTRVIQVISKHDWEKQRTFANGHEGEITALAWSPNGALLASAGKDGKILLWETKTQSVVARYDYNGVQDIAWHPTNNLVAFTNGEGEVYIYPDFITAQYAVLLRLPTQPSPFIHDPLGEISANGLVRRPQQQQRPDGSHKPATVESGLVAREAVEGGDDDDDSMLNGDYDMMGDDDDDGFVVDDDGAGYTTSGLNGGRKRPHDGDNGPGMHRSAKRAGSGRALWQPQYHQAFQPGSTPWRGNRKYLCLNLVGVVWTVDQDAHYTVTVEFYDREFQRDFHFTDTFLYDKACLNEHGALFSCPPREGASPAPAMVFYRPHESWTQQRLDWRTSLPVGESVVAMSLSASFVTIVTSADYVRVYTLFGVPYRVYRPKSTPIVTCASWRDYVWTLGNGPMAPDGTARLQYTIENVQRDEICQNEDTVALPAGATVRSVFFSDEGDPCIYDSTGTLLTLLHWRQPSRASWVPLLDTTQLARLASGRKHESYYPIAVADRKFHCIILKGGDQYPYFPRPLLSEFEFSIPLGRAPKKANTSGDDEQDGGSAEDDDDATAIRLEHDFVLHGVHSAQLADRLTGGGGKSAYALKTSLARIELETDKTLLQLLALECRAGEERGMRALELVRLMRDGGGKMIEAAGKVAERYGRSVLGSKIRALGERRLQGRMGLLDDEDEEEEE
ncbi:DNA polymerase alpha accessory factor Mcl1 [Sporothrix bragantina]|uniref:DNA polymerase alpha accessory factor Mcl1 n=1 Tax=Sporothrix bragantina TaxID=671064 RepID=A0ABP0C6Q0_9PEZI